VGSWVVVQENDVFSEHPALFALDWPPKIIQRFTINLWHCGPWCHEFCQQNSLTTFRTSSLVTIECCSRPPFSFTSMCLSLNFLRHSLTQLSLITLSPYTPHNQWWIFAALCPSAWRKLITAHTSQLAGAAMIVSMFHQQLLHYTVKMHEGRC
jgi:hypothetical protein